MGYRKALEFLIIDYCINLDSNNQHKIQNKGITSVVKEFIKDDIIKEITVRAFWIANDETHNIRKYEDYNLNDLKKFIDSIVTMIEAKLLYEKIIVEMPYKIKQ